DAVVLQQTCGETGRRAAAIRRTEHRPQRGAADPIAAALVAEHVPPAAGPGRLVPFVPAVGDRSGAGDDDDAGLIGRARFERDERVVDDEHARLVADALHDAADNAGVVRTIDARDAEANGAGDRVAIRQRLLHHFVEDLFHFQIADRLEVGAAAARLREDLSPPVRELADGLRAPGVDAEDVHPLCHQYSLRLNWISRGFRADVICPNVSLVTVHDAVLVSHVLSTPTHCVWLNALMKSARNWRRFSITYKFFDSARSVWLRPGSRKIARRELP